MKTITIDVSHSNEPVYLDKLNFGGKNPGGQEIAVNSRYFLLDGKPWFPIMGEIHYSRYPREYWEESILKMQAGGIDIIATYVFWLHHEEIEGAMQWDGDCDLRYFVELCAQHHLKVFLRIGPWCHGEARNGGFPDWLQQKALSRAPMMIAIWPTSAGGMTPSISRWLVCCIRMAGRLSGFSLRINMGIAAAYAAMRGNVI